MWWNNQSFFFSVFIYRKNESYFERDVKRRKQEVEIILKVKIKTSSVVFLKNWRQQMINTVDRKHDSVIFKFLFSLFQSCRVSTNSKNKTHLEWGRQQHLDFWEFTERQRRIRRVGVTWAEQWHVGGAVTRVTTATQQKSRGLKYNGMEILCETVEEQFDKRGVCSEVKLTWGICNFPLNLCLKCFCIFWERRTRPLKHPVSQGKHQNDINLIKQFIRAENILSSQSEWSSGERLSSYWLLVSCREGGGV